MDQRLVASTTFIRMLSDENVENTPAILAAAEQITRTKNLVPFAKYSSVRYESALNLGR